MSDKSGPHHPTKSGHMLIFPGRLSIRLSVRLSQNCVHSITLRPFKEIFAKLGTNVDHD